MRAMRIGIWMGAAMAIAAPAFAQAPAPLPRFVIDVRGALARLGSDLTTAKDLQSDATALPGKSLGGSFGAHVYPLRRRGFAIGIGAESIFAGTSAAITTTADPPGSATIARRLRGVSAVVSLNFGSRNGWSYLSVGDGPLEFESTSSAVPHGTAAARMTQNAGGGARWFTRPRLAATFDVRFYLTRPAPATSATAGRDRKRVIVFAVGISIR